MKIGLINPKWPGRFNDERLANFYHQLAKFDEEYSGMYPSLALLTLASIIPERVEVEIIDENYGEINFQTQFDLIGITAFTAQAYRAYEIAEKFRKQGVPVVIGGIHATLLPDEVSCHADAVFAGEAEEMLPKLIEDFQNGRMLKIYHGGLVDLKKTPHPRYDLVDAMALGKKAPGRKMFIPIQVTRGCPYRCSFCSISEMYGARYRKKIISQIMAEIEVIKAHFSFDEGEISFVDDNLFADRKFAYDLFSELRSYKVKFNCMADISIAEDLPLLNLLRETGCSLLTLGLESLEEKSLKEVGKHKLKYLPRYSECIRKIHDCGIRTGTFFIFGWDHDTTETFSKTSDFILENRIIGPKFLICTPLPRTRLARKLDQEGRILEKNYWDKCNLLNVLYKPAKMSVAQLEDEFYGIYCKTYNALRSVAAAFSGLGLE